MVIRLRPDVQQALREYNLRTVGRDMNARGIVDDPEVITRLVRLAMPGEEINDTILRLLRGNVSVAVN
jgi:hypothetical protein